MNRTVRPITRIQDRRRSRELGERLAQLVPGGAHTYAKGEDQYPEGVAPIIEHGLGSHVWDVDGNEYIEYGAGLRSVTLGHADPRVIEVAHRAMQLGTNFTRPSRIEVEAAEAMVGLIASADMVKFAKNGSDATTAAVRLARAATGRSGVIVCADQPFFSTDDWFIGTTAMPAGIPDAWRPYTAGFRYNDLDSLAGRFAEHPGDIACVVMEAATSVEPVAGFLEGVRALCDRHGALLVFDEMITGFRWHARGAEHVYGVRPDLSTFGKALGNGFAVAALTGRRALMERGGLRSTDERVFLLSTTHGAETHALAVALEVMRRYRDEGVADRLADRGDRLRAGLATVITGAGVGERFLVSGRSCNLVFATLDPDGDRSQAYRTLFLQELLDRGIIAPSLVVTAAHTDDDIDRTVDVVGEALQIYRRALEDGVDAYLRGRPVKPVFRPYA